MTLDNKGIEPFPEEGVTVGDKWISKEHLDELRWLCDHMDPEASKEILKDMKELIEEGQFDIDTDELSEEANDKESEI